MSKVKLKRVEQISRKTVSDAPYQYSCEECGKPAELIDVSRWPAVMYCEECSTGREEEGVFMPVVNSPRMGICSYCGTYDQYQYNPAAK